MRNISLSFLVLVNEIAALQSQLVSVFHTETRTAKGVHISSLSETYGTAAQKALPCWKTTSRASEPTSRRALCSD
jgi:hypothetical protein